jgi:hypothetical protein
MKQKCTDKDSDDMRIKRSLRIIKLDDIDLANCAKYTSRVIINAIANYEIVYNAPTFGRHIDKEAILDEHRKHIASAIKTLRTVASEMKRLSSPKETVEKWSAFADKCEARMNDHDISKTLLG